MATLARLVQTIGHFDHRGRAAIGRLTIPLTEAGLIRIGSTGSGARHQTPADAAHLLLAVGCQEPPANVVSAVEAFGAAKARSCNWHAHGQDGCEAFDAIADATTLHEALVTALEVAPEIVFLAETRARVLHPRSAQAAFDAAIRGLVIDVRVALFRPQGVACVRLVDSTDERGPKNLAAIWFDGAKLDSVPPGGNAVTVTSEFGLALIGPVAFELRDRGNDRDKHRKAGNQTPSGGARGNTRASGPAAGSGSIQPAQRRETVRAATLAHAGGDDE